MVGKKEEIIEEIAHILTTKGTQYGEVFQGVPDMLKILYQHRFNSETKTYSFTEKDLESILVIVRVLDKLQRVATGNEGTESAWIDITGYSILEEERIRIKKGKE